MGNYASGQQWDIVCHNTSSLLGVIDICAHMIVRLMLLAVVDDTYKRYITAVTLINDKKISATSAFNCSDYPVTINIVRSRMAHRIKGR